jgi:hypothetical protein
MECRKIVNLLSAFIDAELDGKRRKMVEEHLQECSDCSERLRELKLISLSIQSIPPLKAPPRFEDVVMARLASPPTRPHDATLLDRILPVFPLRWAVGFGVPAFGLLLLFMLIPPNRTTTLPAGDSPGLARETNLHPNGPASAVMGQVNLYPVSDRLMQFTSGRVDRRGAVTTASRAPFVVRHGSWRYRDDNSGIAAEDDSSSEMLVKEAEPGAIFAQPKQVVCPPCTAQLDTLTFFPGSKAKPLYFKAVNY